MQSPEQKKVHGTQFKLEFYSPLKVLISTLLVTLDILAYCIQPLGSSQNPLARLHLIKFTFSTRCCCLVAFLVWYNIVLKVSGIVQEQYKNSTRIVQVIANTY